MKKLFMIISLSLVLVLAFGLVACKVTLPDGPDDKNDKGKFTNLTTAESVFGFSAASAGMIVSSMSDGAAVNLSSENLSTTSNPSATTLSVAISDNASLGKTSDVSDVPDAEKTPDFDGIETTELDRYMALVESLLSDGGFNIDSQPSEREGFSEKTVVSYKDMKGNSLQYVMYYNQILKGTETDDDGEIEENYSIEGVMVIDGKDYEIRGEKTNETELDESETETEFVVKLSDTRYIRVEQSVETENGESEQEYSYSVYDNGRLIERSTFSYETEQNETELKMTSFKDGKTQVFYFEKELKKGEEVIEIHIGNGKSGKGYIVRIETDENGNNRYVYEPTKFDD